jgi:predicted aspartyl protease
MMPLNIADGLPFVEITLRHSTISITIHKALIDTGSMSTIIQFTSPLQAKVGFMPCGFNVHSCKGLF